MEFTYSSAYGSKISACTLAEAREWKKLQAKVTADIVHACDRDVKGNLPLHWACRDPDVPVSMLEILLDAYPEGTQVKNHTGYIPLKLAIENQLPPTFIQLLQQGVEEVNEPIATERSSMNKDDIQRAFLAGSTSFIPDDNNVSVSLEANLPDLLTELNSLRRAMKAQVKIYAQLRKHNWAASMETTNIPAVSIDSRGKYSVSWRQGDVGIRFHNSSAGCRIERLSQGHGITSGIMNCRLGDILVSINRKSVERQSVRSVMEQLLTATKPVELCFLPGDSSSIQYDNERRSEDEEASAWCHSQHEMHEQVLLLVQETISQCESSEAMLISQL